MKKISLRPYVGTIYLCKSRKELHAQYKKLCQEDYPYSDDPKGGRYVKIVDDKSESGTKYLVWAHTKHALAHELAHVILIVFDLVGIDPREAKGEPFCYMLSQLLLDAKQ